MKKVLSILSLIAFLSLSNPVFASPHGPAGHHGGPSMHAGHRAPHVAHRVHAGPHHGHHVRSHAGYSVHAGHHPRHYGWYGHRVGFWGSPWCNCRLGFCNHYYPGVGLHIPMGGASFSLRF